MPGGTWRGQRGRGAGNILPHLMALQVAFIGKTLGKESPHPGRALETDLGFICVTLGRSFNLPEPHFSHL